MRRSVKLGVYGVVLAGVIGGTTAWALIDKTVTVQVDGAKHTVHTVSGHVRDAVDEAGITPGAHDSVRPALSSSLHDGDTIVVDRGRLLSLTVDGATADKWVTARTVGSALGQLEISPASWTSAPLNTALPLATTRLEIRTPKPITIFADGTARGVVSTDLTVSAAVTTAAVTMGADDELSLDPNTPVTAGLTVTVYRVTYAEVTEAQTLDYNVVEQQDSTLTTGSKVTATKGKAGAADSVYKVKVVDGQEAARTLVSQNVTVAPVDQVVRVGTKPVQITAAPSTPSTGSTSAPAASAPVSVDPGSAQDIARQMMLAQYGWGDDQFNCLVSLWNRESGWRVNAGNQSSGAYGIPQALPGSKMAAFGSDWQTNPATQIAWGLSYISGRYGTPCGAWSHFQSNNWY